MIVTKNATSCVDIVEKARSHIYHVQLINFKVRCIDYHTFKNIYIKIYGSV